MISILYEVSLYGTPPINFWERYIRENNLAELTIILLPSVRLEKGRFSYDAYIKKPSLEEIHFKVNWKIDLPAFVVYVLQYILNFVAFFVLLARSKKFRFDVVFGETAFGGAIIYLHRLLGLSKYSIFMNGDVTPQQNGSTPFYLSGDSPHIKVADQALIFVQRLLRKLGMKNDLLWYPNELTANWDKENGYVPKDKLILPTVLVSHEETAKTVNARKNKSPKMVLGYIGRLDDLAGVDMSLEVLVHLSKKIPEVKIIYVGGGGVSVEKYKNKAKSLGVEANVEFAGFIPDFKDAANILSQAAFGLALYRPDELNVSLFAEPGKPKDYVRMGLPVVITRGGPVVGETMAKLGAALLVDYDAGSIASELEKALTDLGSYQNLLDGVSRFSQSYDYKIYFSQLFNYLTDAVKRLERS